MDEPSREVNVRGVEDHRVEVCVAEQQVPVWAKQARDLPQEPTLIREALEHVVADRRIDATVLERQRGPQVGAHEPDMRIASEELRRFSLNSDELDPGAESLAQRLQRLSAATAQIHDRSRAFDGQCRGEPAISDGDGDHAMQPKPRAGI